MRAEEDYLKIREEQGEPTEFADGFGIKAVLAKSFARIHWANLINFGIPPLVFVRPVDYDTIEQGDRLEIHDLVESIRAGRHVIVRNVTRNAEIPMTYNLSERQKEVLAAGGQLNYTRAQAGKHGSHLLCVLGNKGHRHQPFHAQVWQGHNLGHSLL